jgi:hypothetical protein
MENRFFIISVEAAAWEARREPQHGRRLGSQTKFGASGCEDRRRPVQSHAPFRLPLRAPRMRT